MFQSDLQCTDNVCLCRDEARYYWNNVDEKCEKRKCNSGNANVRDKCKQHDFMNRYFLVYICPFSC